MKIPLKLSQNGKQSTKAAQAKVLERDLLSAKKGDWTARNNLVRSFTPLLTTLAEKRSDNVAKINQYIEAGKNGLYTAIKKYKSSIGAERFQIFALDFIETSMNRVGKGDESAVRPGGFFSRLFGR